VHVDNLPNITHLLNAWQNGDAEAEVLLSAQVYAALKQLARVRLLRQPGAQMVATELVNEAMLQLLDRQLDWRSRAHFFAVASSKMRDVLVDEARKRSASKHGGDLVRVSTEQLLEVVDGGTDILPLHEALNRLSQAEPRAARILEMTYFGGMQAHEISAVLPVSVATIERDLRFGRKWLASELAT
jgi:RNA polymerase sigma factor (TIGR02999 family)